MSKAIVVNGNDCYHGVTLKYENVISIVTESLGWTQQWAQVPYGNGVATQLTGYIGGEGEAPTENIGWYVGIDGFVENIEDAVISGLQGDEGLSAYQVAVKNGFEGTEQEWEDSLKGKDGVSPVIAVITPTDPAPTLDGVYKPTITQNEAGTPIVYTNAGSISVNTAVGGADYGKMVEFIRSQNGTVWIKNSYPLPKVNVIDNLKSTSKDNALSANQGRVLEEEYEELDEKVKYGHSLDLLRNIPYDAKSRGSSGGLLPINLVQTKQPRGLGLNTVVKTTVNTEVLIDKSIDNDIFILKFKANEGISTAGAVGLIAGDIEFNSIGVSYRADGSIFTTKSSGIANSISIANIRSASSIYSYKGNDELSIEINRYKRTTRSCLNGVWSPEIALTGNWNQRINIIIRGTIGISNVGIYSFNVEDAKTTFYIDSTNGIDSNTGSISSPLKTISMGIYKSIGIENAKIIIAGGVYRESLDLSLLQSQNIEIIAQSPELVQVFGSDQLTGWIKTAGQTNVYQIPFTGNIANFSRIGKIFFEHGNPSMAINLSDIDALQRGLSHRLPFSVIHPVESIGAVDASPASYFIELGILYMHTGNSSSPATNGFLYENIVRPGTITFTPTPTRMPNLYLKNIQFLYHMGVGFRGLNTVTRHMCTSLASSAAGGFMDDTAFTISYKDESGFCDGDGINGHYTKMPDYTNKDQREGVQNGYYIDPWCHDNLDDGLSFHERSDITIQGGLFEYNGDGGVRQSNDALFRIYSAKARGNGWDMSGGTRGSGFDTVNTPSANRRIGSMTLYDCISEINRNGIAVISGDAITNAYNCTARNNTEAEFRAESGILNANNCRATNPDTAKLKVVSGTGVINVINDEILI